MDTDNSRGSLCQPYAIIEITVPLAVLGYPPTANASAKGGYEIRPQLPFLDFGGV